ncbi:hypothetical protein KCU90_g1558, partial [Aureobasidium melanogenum]
LLRTFLAIAKEGSALRRLEEQLGLRLVDRHGPRIEVTQAGIEVKQIAEDVYGTISRLSLAEVDRDHDISGMVRVSTVSGIDFPAYDTFLAEFHRTYPRIELESQEMRSADVVNSLQQKSATLGLTPRRALPKRLDSRVFLRQRDIQLADLAGEKFVSFTGDKVGDHMSPLTFFRDEMGFTGRVVGSSSSMTEVRRFIFAGFGIGCLPEHVVRDDIAQGRLQRLPPDGGVADLDIYMLWSQDRKLSTAEAAFIDALNVFIDGQTEAAEL